MGSASSSTRGSTGSALLAHDSEVARRLPASERYFGLENFGNTCYCNSVLQALYFCIPFRLAVLSWLKQQRFAMTNHKQGGNGGDGGGGGGFFSSRTPSSLIDETLLGALGCLFENISAQKKKTGSVGPRSFVQLLRKQNPLFRSAMQQDAHEFLNYLLNDFADMLDRQQRQQQQQEERQISNQPRSSSDKTLNHRSSDSNKAVQANDNIHGGANGNGNGDATNGELQHAQVGPSSSSSTPPPPPSSTSPPSQSQLQRQPPLPSFVRELCQGHVVNETKCLTCEHITIREEPFLDISLDIEENSSLSQCLRNFSRTDTLRCSDKFYCERCASLQEAHRRIYIRQLPKLLIVHMKRFKYVEHLGRYVKLCYRVNFPMELRLTEAGPSPSQSQSHPPSSTSIGKSGVIIQEEVKGGEPTPDVHNDHSRLQVGEDGSGLVENEVAYQLSAAIIHVGTTANAGHYVTCVKSRDQWLLFDDDAVRPIEAETMLQFSFGQYYGASGTSNSSGYILFYEQAPDTRGVVSSPPNRPP